MECAKCEGSRLEKTSVNVEDRGRPGREKDYVELELDWCPACGGVWFGKDELSRYLDAAITRLPPLAETVEAARDAARARCPACRTPLAKGPAPGNPAVTIDGCPTCGGLWLDAGELERASGKGLPLSDRLKAAFGGLKP